MGLTLGKCFLLGLQVLQQLQLLKTQKRNILQDPCHGQIAQHLCIRKEKTNEQLKDRDGEGIGTAVRLVSLEHCDNNQLTKQAS